MSCKVNFGYFTFFILVTIILKVFFLNFTLELVLFT